MKAPLALVWCVALLLAPGIAQAHAYLVASSPAANATVASSPSEIAVSFNQPVTIESGHALVVMRTDGTPVPCAGGPRRDPGNGTRVICKLASPLPLGEYAVFWLVTSADTHVVHGAFSFGVGVAVRKPPGVIDYPYDPSGILANVFRWLSLLGAALVAGTLTFGAFVLRADAFPAAAGPALASLSRSRAALCRVGVCVAAFAGILALDVQAAAATGSDALGAIPSLPSVIVGSTWGLAWLARMFALAGIGLLTWRGSMSLVALGLCALLILSFSQSGHAVVSSATFAADWVHMACASIWFGGLAIFSAGWKRALTAIEETARPAFSAMVISRFSVIALPAVILLVASGVYGSVAHDVTWSSPAESLYARIILAKVVLLLPLLALGYHHFRSGRGPATRGFTATVTSEAALIVVVLALSAVLSGLPPPHPPGSGHG